jgi:Flp pilus assembly protein TadB
MAMNNSSTQLLVILLGALTGGGVFLVIVAIRGLPVKPDTGPSWLERQVREALSWRGAASLVIGVIALLLTRWVVAGIAIALLAFSWRSLGGAAEERRAIARLEGLATWTESLRDTIAGAVGLEQAIPSSMRVATPVIQEPLQLLVDRLHTRVPMPQALRRFADDLDDPSADMIIAALIINSRLRGPGLRDLLGALADSVREELDMRRKVNSSRRSTRRSVQIVVLVSVGMAIALAILNRSFLSPYNSAGGQLILAVVAAIYAAGIGWLRRLAKFDSPQRLLGRDSVTPGTPSPSLYSTEPETVGSRRGGDL